MHRPSLLKARQALFVFEYLDQFTRQNHAYHERWVTTSIEATTSYDDGLEFVDEFQQEFPGRKPDPSQNIASIRLRRLLKELYEDGYLERGRLSNDFKNVPQDPSWQYVYRLPQVHVKRVKLEWLTWAELASSWQGVDIELLAD